MTHNYNWDSARYSSYLALKNFCMVSIFLGLSFLGLYLSTGTVWINDIIVSPIHSPYLVPSLGLLVLAALAQSAIMPFHNWILSSLNSPTPVSAIMHAGIINGGGFILARFAPLLFDNAFLLTCIFVIGLLTALLGTALKLMQHDIKRMLACSTIGQMGFMFVQCGLGLFPNAIAHLCLHGMFKAYLFLGHASLLNDEVKQKNKIYSVPYIGLSLLFGIVGSLCFAVANKTEWFSYDTTFVQNCVALLFCSQIALALYRSTKIQSNILILFACSMIGYIYGSITHLFEWLLSSMQIYKAQPLDLFHWSAIFLLTIPWLVIVLSQTKLSIQTKYLKYLYVALLNHSQPNPRTVTAIRKNYQF